jgi:tetratricopeptide (TPR) repeat protein
MRYLNFDLEIREKREEGYSLRVVAPGGEADTVMRLPFDESRLEDELTKLEKAIRRSAGPVREAASGEGTVAREFGDALFTALFAKDAAELFEAGIRQQQEESEDTGLRIRLNIHDPKMAALPWECMYDSASGEYLSLSRLTPIVRYWQASSVEPSPVCPPLRVLGLISTPDDLARLNTERERSRIEVALKRLKQIGKVELTWLNGKTWRDLQRELRNGDWHVFHFVGHGKFDERIGEGSIALETESGCANWILASQLAQLLRDEPPLRLVVLNACFGARGGLHDEASSTAAILVRHGVPAVLAMQNAISDDAANVCARDFYEAVADGLAVDDAVSEVRKAILGACAGSLEWITPVLHIGCENSILFRMGPTPEPPEPERSLSREYVRGLISDGRSARAFELVQAELSNRPTELLFDLWCECLSAVEDARQALAAARDLHRLRGSDIYAACCVSVALANLGRHADAQAAIAEFVTPENESFFPVQFARYSIASSTDDDSLAAQVVDRLMAMRPEHPQVLCAKAEVELERGNVDAASKLTEAALEYNRGHLNAYFLRAMICFARGDVKDRVANSIRPSLRIMERVSRDHYTTRLVRGLLLMIREDYRGARDEYVAALDDPVVSGHDSVAAVLLGLRAICNLRLDLDDDARRDAAACLERDETNSQGLIVRGIMRVQEDKFEEALEDLNRGLQATPDHVQALTMRGFCHMFNQHWRASIDDFEAALQHAPTYVEAKIGITYATILEAMLEFGKRGIGFGYLYCLRAIPERKLNNVLETYAAGKMSEGSEIILLYDHTFVGSAKDGFSITEEKFIAHNWWSWWKSESFAVRLADIHSVRVSGDNLVVNGFEVRTCHLSNTEGLNAFAEVLRKLSSLHQKLEGKQDRKRAT